MGECFNIGLQAGKNVTKAVDKYIEENKEEEYDFIPDKKKLLDNGSTIYEWVTKWTLLLEGLIKELKTFNDKEGEENAYRMVCAGDEGSENEYGNSAGYFEYMDLYIEHKVVFPENFEEKIEINRELPATIIDIIEDFLAEKKVSVINEDAAREIAKVRGNYPPGTPDSDIAKDMGLANIYGEDFDYLMDKITDTCRNFGIDIKDKWPS